MKSKSVLLESLFPALRRLDGMLGSAIERARRESNAAEAFRGLYIAHADIQRSLRGAPGDPRYSTRAADEFAPVDSPLALLVAEYELCPFDLDILLIVLAPEIDRRYERVYAYLQDDVTRRRPTVDLCLDLLCNSELDRIARRLHFAPDAPLIRHGIVELGADSGVGLLGQALWVDDQIVSLLLEHSAIDRRAAAFCRYLDASADPLSSRHATVVELVRRAYAENAPLLLGVAGAPGSGKRRTASAIASAAGLPLLELDTGALLRAEPTLASGLRLALREARWRGAALYISGTEHLEIEAHAVERRTLQRALESQRGIVMLASTRAVSLLFGALAIEPMRIGSLLPAERQQVWLGVLGAAAEQVSPEELK